MVESKMSLYGYKFESKTNYELLKKSGLASKELKSIDKDGDKKISNKELKDFDVSKLKSSASEDELIEFEGDDFEDDNVFSKNVAVSADAAIQNTESNDDMASEETHKGHRGKGAHKSGKSHGHHGNKRGDKAEGSGHGKRPRGAKPSRKPSRKPGGDKRPSGLDNSSNAETMHSNEQAQEQEEE